MSELSEAVFQFEEFTARTKNIIRSLVKARDVRNEELKLLKDFIAILYEQRHLLPEEIKQKLEEQMPEMLAKERLTRAEDDVSVALLEGALAMEANA